MADPYPSLASSPDPRRWLRIGNFLVTLLQSLRGHEVTPWSGCFSPFSVPLGLLGEQLRGGVPLWFLKLLLMWPVALSCQTALASVASSGAPCLQVMVMSL